MNSQKPNSLARGIVAMLINRKRIAARLLRRANELNLPKEIIDNCLMVYIESNNAAEIARRMLRGDID